MIGHKLGEFSLTRKFQRHGGKMQRELEAAQKQKEIEAAQAAKAVVAGPDGAAAGAPVKK
jgi:small subunit ribosomal protein S19